MKQPKITLTGILAMLSTRASHVPFYARLVVRITFTEPPTGKR